MILYKSQVRSYNAHIKGCQFVSMERLRRRRRESDLNRRLLFATSWRTTVDIIFQGDANPDIVNDMFSSQSSTGSSFQEILEEELTNSFEDVGTISVSNVDTIEIEDPNSSADNLMILIISIGVAVFSLLCVLLMFCFGCGMYHGIKKSNAPINTVVPGVTVELVQETTTTTTTTQQNSSNNIPTAAPIGEVVETPVVDMKTGEQYRARKASRPMMEWIKKARRSFITYGKGTNDSAKNSTTTKDAWL